MKSNQSYASTQDHLDIEDIRDDMLVLKDGRVVIILETTAVNFSLLSEVEQDAKIKAFAGLLNSINYNLEILVHTERVDVSRYIVTLENYLETQTSEKIRYQIENYIDFIKNLIRKNDVLDKRFFIIIPYVPYGVKRTSPLRQVFGKPDRIIDMEKILQTAKVDLYPKKDGIVKLLLRMGIKARQLSTEEIIKLFYKLYNIDSGFLPKANFVEADYAGDIVGTKNDILNQADIPDATDTAKQQPGAVSAQ